MSNFKFTLYSSILLDFILLGNLQVESTLPVHLHSNCVITTVASPFRYRELQLPETSTETIIYTYTFFESHHFQLSIPKEILYVNKSIIQHGYLRLFQNQKTASCLMYMLFTSSFPETTSAIQNSGFSTSERVLFCISLDQKHNARNILHSFPNLVHRSDLEPFHAPLLFYMKSNPTVFIYCYFCPNHRTFHTHTMGLNMLEIFKIYDIINGQGYGLHLRMELPGGIPAFTVWDEFSGCFKIFTGGNQSLQGLNQALLKCPITESLQLSLLQDMLNASVVPNLMDFPFSEWSTMNWFAHLVVMENMIGGISLEIVSRRSTVYYPQYDDHERAIACLNIADASSFDFSMFAAMTPMIWLSLLILLIIYSFFCKSLMKAVDIIRPLFGISCVLNHQRIFLSILLISMVWLTNAYQAGISSELLSFSKFPTFLDFIKEGYKLDFGNLCRYIMPFLNLILSVAERTWLKKHFNGLDFSDIFITNASLYNIDDKGFARFLKQSVENKVILSAVVHDKYGMGLYNTLGKKIWLVEDKFYCKSFNIRKDISFELKPSLRAYGYLTKKASHIMYQWHLMGILIKLENLKSSLRQVHVKSSLKIESLSALRDPGKLSIWSPVGIMGLVCFVLGSALLLLKIVQWIFLSERCKNLCNFTKPNFFCKQILRIFF